MRRRVRASFIGGAAPLAVLLSMAACGDGDVETGRAAFQAYCTDCHGPRGQGDGPMSALLDGAVPDLTGLSARNGGVFPLGYVLQAVGRPSELHGEITAMPDFAILLGGRSARVTAPDGQAVDTTGPVLGLARYLESIQRPAEADATMARPG